MRASLLAVRIQAKLREQGWKACEFCRLPVAPGTMAAHLAGLHPDEVTYHGSVRVGQEMAR